MGNIKIPKECGAISKNGIITKELPVYQYWVSIMNEEKVSIKEMQEDKVSSFSGDFIPTNNFANTDVLSMLNLFFDYRKEHNCYIKLLEKGNVQNREEILQEFERLFLNRKQNAIFVNQKNEFYTAMTKFEQNFDKIIDFFDNDKFSKVDNIELEKIIKYYFNANLVVDYLPIDNNGYIGAVENISNIPKETLCVYHCATVYDVFFAAVHYCKIYNIKLKSCKLCHSFFFAQNLKEQYCSRKFMYTDWENKTHSFPRCGGKTGARKKIWDKLQAKRITIQKWLSVHPIALSTFNTDCDEMVEKVKSNPCIENLLLFEKFLYIDCNKYHEKYKRINFYK